MVRQNWLANLRSGNFDVEDTHGLDISVCKFDKDKGNG